MEAKGALSQVPKTFNYQSPLGFRFWIKRLPEVNYFVKKVNVPGIQLPAASEMTPYQEIPQPGDHLQYAPLVLEFFVDEGFKNYVELHKWMRAIRGGDRSGQEYARLVKQPEYTGEGVRSEILLTLLDSQRNSILDVNYHEAWPSQLTTLQFDSTLNELPYLTATAVFRYSTYDFGKNL